MNDSHENRTGKTSAPVRPVLLTSLALLIVGMAGYFLLPRGPLIFYAFAHLGALGLLGLIGSGVGLLARRKGRDYWTAFALGGLLPIVLGFVAAAMVGNHWSCGGSVSLAVAVIVALVYAFISKRPITKTAPAVE